jgi:hypothetical protein
MKRSKRLKRLQRPESLLDHVRQFLIPLAWKQARRGAPRPGAASTRAGISSP